MTDFVDLVACLQAETQVDIGEAEVRKTDRERPFSSLGVFSHNSGLLRAVGMHNTASASNVGISEQSRVPRPTQRKLGQFFRQGYRPFVDDENSAYFLINPTTEEVLKYDPSTKEFNPVPIDQLSEPY